MLFLRAAEAYILSGDLRNHHSSPDTVYFLLISTIHCHYPLRMRLIQFLFAFTLFALAYAIPQSPVGSSGSGDTGGTNSGDAVGSAAAASSASLGNQEFSSTNPLSFLD